MTGGRWKVEGGRWKVSYGPRAGVKHKQPVD